MKQSISELYRKTQVPTCQLTLSQQATSLKESWQGGQRGRYGKLNLMFNARVRFRIPFGESTFSRVLSPQLKADAFQTAVIMKKMHRELYLLSRLRMARYKPSC